MTTAGEEACAVCRGIERARLEPSQAAALPRVFCSTCHGRIDVVVVSRGGRPVPAYSATEEAA
ncbi:hypothetical protein [Anaeromyxobacter sp. SG66]|uniref:hypothetical protein n=1 Tax=Anaeromyxobacter sp. SG66 TaxID=2925410 RepID=UPI001F59D721|nr:hypothetical protein [Anaeromyxobacter sp. SG66]